MTRRPNIIWLVYDSIRSDHTGVGGYERPTTPNLDRIAAKPNGVGFTDAIAHGIWSLPSSASMLTGRHPSYHQTGLQNEVLPEEIQTVPERLSEEGWRTVGLSGNSYFTEGRGLNRGFDDFTRLITVPLQDSNVLSVGGPWTLFKFLVNLRRHSGGYTLDARRHSANYLLYDIAKRQLTSLYRGDGPFFYYAHFPGAHHPYAPPKRFRDEFASGSGMGPDKSLEFAVERTADVYREIAAGCEYEPVEWRAIRDMYDALLAHTDSLAGDLFDHINSHSNGDTIVVLTADHGDLLGEYGLLSHKLVLHDALVNVPLVVHGLPELVGRDDEVVQHVDVMQTILEQSGVSTEGMDGLDLVTSQREFAVSQRGSGTYTNTIRKLEEYDGCIDTSRFSAGLLTAIRSDRFKLVDQERGRSLYRLPEETAEVSKEHPEDRSRLDERLNGWLAEHDEQVITAASTDLTDSAKRRLRDLGYVVD